LVNGVACHLHDPRRVGQLAAQALIGSIDLGVSPRQPVLVRPSEPYWCE
jgi:hypothetical protein